MFYREDMQVILGKTSVENLHNLGISATSSAPVTRVRSLAKVGEKIVEERSSGD